LTENSILKAVRFSFVEWPWWAEPPRHLVVILIRFSLLLSG